MNKIRFKLATPERVLHEEDAVDAVSCPTPLGEVTILPDHIPLVAVIEPGELKVREDNTTRYLAVTGGFLEVRPGNEVVVLADAAERAEEIDMERAEEARERARKLMREKTQDVEEFAAAQAALEKSMARIRVARKRKYKDVGRGIDPVQNPGQ